MTGELIKDYEEIEFEGMMTTASKAVIKKQKLRLAEDVCAAIGEWYLEWKPKIADYKNHSHRLGYAKEMLKTKLCEIIEK